MTDPARDTARQQDRDEIVRLTTILTEAVEWFEGNLPMRGTPIWLERARSALGRKPR